MFFIRNTLEPALASNVNVTLYGCILLLKLKPQSPDNSLRFDRLKTRAESQHSLDIFLIIAIFMKLNLKGRGNRMPRTSPYTPEQKAAILVAVKDARKEGQWSDALKAAEEAGFKGGLGYLMKLASSNGTPKPPKSTNAANTPEAVSGKKPRGRPKGSTNVAKRGAGRPKATSAGNGAGLNEIDRIVAQMVEQRLAVALEKAVTSLENAARELKSL